MRPTTTSHELAGALIETAVERLELTARNLPGLRLPTTYAGHLVDSSSRCIQAWTLSALAEFGVDRIGGADIREVALDALEAVEPTTEGFGSWWYAEALHRLGGLDVISDADRAIETIRSPGISDTITSPNNY